MSIAISLAFMQAFYQLPDSIQKRTIEFLEKFEANPQAPGFNYESIVAAVDKKMRSVRINDTYRAIVKRDEETGTYILLWVDHHDEAYDWAATKRCEINAVTGKIQVYSVETTNAPDVSEKAESVRGIFASCSDDELLKLGVPPRQIGLVKGLQDYKRFCNCKYLLPDDVVENLEWIANDIPVAEVISMISDGNDPAGNKSEENMAGSSFVIIDGQEELRAVINGSLEKWRVFLHPSQRDVVEKDYSGPARVLGEAGTGKTVVAMHRAKRLAGMLDKGQKILFTTFTTNLADDIKANLRKICSDTEYNHIEVTSIDAWVSRFLEKRKYNSRLVYGNDLDNYWLKAIQNADTAGFEKDFYKEEWATVIAPNEAFTCDDYVRASRIGRGTRLDRTKKMQVWNVFEEFINLTKTVNILDIDSAMSVCRDLIAQDPVCDEYPCVIVDEGQDFSTNAYSLLRSIAGAEHKNDIFIVGDAHQRIYRRKAVLSKCGINIKGRSSHLRINYRTTEEIRKYAYAILTGMSFDDLDGGADDSRESRSFTHGPEPVVRNFATATEEASFIIDEVKRLLANGVLAKDICVVARTKKLLDNYATAFSSASIRSYEIKSSKVDDRSLDGIRLATMHRVKGLEFQYVFVVSVNQGIVPLEAAIDHTDPVSESETMKAEKCLIYVALTRTQKCAYVTSFGKVSSILPKMV